VPSDSSRPVTIHDVAALSGVSIATVTRALQGSPHVRPETSARVLASATRLGYRPDANARALVMGTSRTIGVLIPSLVQPYWAEIAAAIERRAGEQGYSVVLASSQGEAEREQAMLDMLFGKRLDGVIVGAVSSDPDDWSADARTPVVLLEWDATPQWELLEELSDGPLRPRLRRLPEEIPDGAWSAHVSTDDTAGGALSARHLLALGHSQIAFIVGPPVRPYLLRLLGVRGALEEAGEELGAVVATADTFEGGEAVARDLLAADNRPTALVCCSDAIAVGAVKAARELGLDIPGDVSVMGYDDIELAAYVEPPLTTLRNPMRELGELALDLLLLARASEHEPVSRRLTATLIERASTGPAPGR
jgi:LacI family transcriptional regulator